MSLFAPGDPLETLEILDDLGVSVVLDEVTNKLRARPAPLPALARELIVANRALLHAVLLGRCTRRHVWARCDQCGEGRMVQSGRTPSCAMTPGCKGRHRAEEKEKTKEPTEAHPAQCVDDLGAVTPPTRPGCPGRAKR